MPKAAPDADRQAMVDAYMGGLSFEEAGKKFGYSSMAVRRELKRRGIASRLRRISPEQRARVKALYADGAPMHRIVGLTGVTIGSVWRILSAEGLNRPHRVYALNEAYFADVRTEEQAWALGCFPQYLDKLRRRLGLK